MVFMSKMRYAWLIVLLLPLQSCAVYYSAAPIEAWVVEAETGKPLEGVTITANWQLKGGLEGGNEVGQMMVMEAVTDQKGRFYFPAWGPKKNNTEGHIKDEAPRLLLFKSGYSYLRLFNDTAVTDRPGPSLKSDWNGKVVKMVRFKGALDEYAQNIYELSSNIESVIGLSEGARDCYWKKIPHMLVALNNMSHSFEAQGVKLKGWRGGQRIIRIEDIPSDSHCGSSVQGFFRSYMQ